MVAASAFESEFSGSHFFVAQSLFPPLHLHLDQREFLQNESSNLYRSKYLVYVNLCSNQSKRFFNLAFLKCFAIKRSKFVERFSFVVSFCFDRSLPLFIVLIYGFGFSPCGLDAVDKACLGLLAQN